MKRILIFWFFGALLLTFAGFWLVKGLPAGRQGRQSAPKVEPKIETKSESEFSQAVDEAKKKEEEKKRQEEETKAFIANYGPCRNIPILMYHHVGNGTNWLFVSTETFASQMDYLAQRGFVSVTLSEVVNSLQSGSPLGVKPVVLTFDDGYRDFYTNAYPILKSHNFRATLFVISQHVGGSEYVTWEQLREMQSSGLVTIGDHTLSHPSLPILTEERLRDEILSAKNILEEHLGVLVNVFSYPYGGVDAGGERILKENAFVAAVTTKRGLSCAKLPYDLPRIRIGNSPLAGYGF